MPLVSSETVTELMRILAYPKFQLTTDEQFEALDSYLPFCEVVEIIKQCPVLCRDVKDQPLLDLSQSGKADLLVTGDEDLLALAGKTEFVIETPEEYRRRIAGGEEKP